MYKDGLFVLDNPVSCFVFFQEFGLISLTIKGEIESTITIPFYFGALGGIGLLFGKFFYDDKRGKRHFEGAREEAKYVDAKIAEAF